MPAGSPVGLQQLQRMQGMTWGDGAGHDYHLWFDGPTLYCDAGGLTLTVGLLTVIAIQGQGGVVLPVAGDLSVSGNVLVAGRVTSNNVGASAKPLLNYVPATLGGPGSLGATSYPVTTLTGTGNKALTAFTVAGLPATAVAADVEIILIPGTNAVGDTGALFTSTSQTGFPNVEAIISNASYAQAVASGRTPCVPGATNQLAYVIVTAGTWTLSVQLLGWYEPA